VVIIPDDGGKSQTYKIWLPKSQSEVKELEPEDGEQIVFTIPLWLYQSKLQEIEENFGKEYKIAEVRP